jgi:voltage-gated potassium channel Kch
MLQTAVRTHSESEYTHLQDVGVGFVVLGERELALTIADSTLSCFGLPASRRPPTVQPTGTSAS